MDFSGLTFLDGQLVRRDLGYLLAVNDQRAEAGEEHGLILQLYSGDWQVLSQPHKLISSTFSQQPMNQFVAVAENGRATVLSRGMVINELIADGEHTPSRNGPLIEVTSVAGGHAYAVGACRQAYRRQGEDDWHRLDSSAQTGAKDLADTCFHSIDGFSEDDIYAVGWEGEIWHYDGVVWGEKGSPTNLALYEVKCAEDGYVYACGQAGMLVVGRDDTWQVIEQDVTEEDFWGLEWFQERLYIASLNFLYVLESSAFSPVDMGATPLPRSCYELTGADGLLWSIGGKDVMQFDGVKWETVAEGSTG